MANSEMTFARFWPRYVRAHQCHWCRALHYLGTTTGIALLVVGLTIGPWWWIGVGVAVGYGCAWLGHGIFAGNRPETFGYPAYSFLADFKMLGLAATGRMKAEVERHRQAEDQSR